MEKVLSLASMAIGGLSLVVFALDLFLQIPFGRLNSMIDIMATVASGLVVYLGWNAYQDQR